MVDRFNSDWEAEGFLWQMDRQTDICDSRVAFVIENWIKNFDWQINQGISIQELNNQWEAERVVRYSIWLYSGWAKHFWAKGAQAAQILTKKIFGASVHEKIEI